MKRIRISPHLKEFSNILERGINKITYEKIREMILSSNLPLNEKKRKYAALVALFSSEGALLIDEEREEHKRFLGYAATARG